MEETVQEAIYGRHFAAEKIEEQEAKEREAAEKEAEEKRKAKEPPPAPQPEPEPEPEKKKGPKDNKEKEPIVMEDKCTQVIVPEQVKNLIPYFRVLY